MDIDVPAPKSGTVRSVGFKAGDHVNRDDVLAVIG
jgi:biotin carboxyl carrier protein